MVLMIVGLSLFFFVHCLRELGLRDRVMDSLPSRGAYRGMISVLALLALVLIVVGKGQSEFIMVWNPPFEWRWLSQKLMGLVCVLVVAGNLPKNHFHLHFHRHPMLCGICLWGIAHLWSNGDLASMILFGSFSLWAGLKAYWLNRSQPVAVQSGSFLWAFIAFVLGVALYALLALFHGPLFGVYVSLT